MDATDAQTVTDTTLLDSARNGDQEAFAQLTEPYRRELRVHCYRFLGSLDDADDVLQETYLRAWRRLSSYEGRASLRAWLYKIATNAALDALDSRRVRGLAPTTYPPAKPGEPFPNPVLEPVWLEPLPETLLDERPTFNPEARYDARESVTLAFLTALQGLPGRQRAVLILRDVLGWNAAETAETLDMSEAAVNSALQRARATLQTPERAPAQRAVSRADDNLMASLLNRYVTCWENADINNLVALLREDVILTMPPIPTWYQGRAAVEAFLAGYLFAGDAAGRFRLKVTQANGAPAFAVYLRDAEGAYQPSALQVATLENGLISRLDDFLVSDSKLFAQFGLPILG